MTATLHPSVRPTGVAAAASRAPWWASLLIGLQAIASEIDYDAVGVRRLPVLVLICMAPLPLLALRSPGLLTMLWARPHRAATIWLGWCLLTIAWSVVPGSSARSMLAILGLWVTAAWYTSSYGFTRFARVITIATSAFLTAGVIRDLTIVLDAESVHRFDGYGLHATDVGRIALVLLVLCVIRIVDRVDRSWSTWWGLGIGSITLVATGTRTTMIAFVICLLVISLRTLGVSRTLLVGASMAAAVVVAFSFIPDPGEFVSRDENAQDISSINGRLTIWTVALNAIEDRPIGGHGFAAGELVFPLASQDGRLPILIEHAHDLPLEIGMTTGLVGLTLFVLSLVSHLGAPRAIDGRLAGVVVLAILLSGVTEAALGRPTMLYLVLAALTTQRAMVLDGRSTPMTVRRLGRPRRGTA